MTTVVLARPAIGRSFDVDAFVDITDAPVTETGWEGTFLRVTFDGDLTDDQAAAVVRRIVSSTPEEEQLRAELVEFLATPPDEVRRGQWLAAITRLLLCVGTGQTPPTGNETP